jgi:hypothetical protein
MINMTILYAKIIRNRYGYIRRNINNPNQIFDCVSSDFMKLMDSSDNSDSSDRSIFMNYKEKNLKDVYTGNAYTNCI